MATSDLLNMSNEIANVNNVNISDPVEDSEAIKAPKGRLKRLQKKPVADDENESNNEQTLKMREAETASEAHSICFVCRKYLKDIIANKSSGKKESDKKRRLDDFASEMRAMQISEQIEEEKTEKKQKKKKEKKEKKSVSKFLDEDLKQNDDEEPLIYDFRSEDEEDGNSGKDRMEEEEEEEDSETRKSKKEKKKRDKSERREKSARRERREKSTRRERPDEAKDAEYVEYTEGDEGGEAAERSERPTREKGALKRLSKKRDEDNLFGDILAKRKAKKEPKNIGDELLQRDASR